MKRSVIINKEKRFAKNYAMGLGYDYHCAYRLFNYHFGIKYFTSGNFNGDFTIDTQKINNALK